jgi:hypothetical protein
VPQRYGETSTLATQISALPAERVCPRFLVAEYLPNLSLQHIAVTVDTKRTEDAHETGKNAYGRHLSISTDATRVMRPTWQSKPKLYEEEAMAI